MKETTFSIPVNGIIEINERNITIRINPAVIIIPTENKAEKTQRFRGSSRTLYDIVLETAQRFVVEKKVNEFTAAELFHKARETYQDLKRNSFTAHVIAVAPNHSSYSHYSSNRDYFEYIGNGKYRLKEDLRID